MEDIDKKEIQLIPEVEAEISHPGVKFRYVSVSSLRDLSYIKIDNGEVKAILLEKVDE